MRGFVLIACLVGASAIEIQKPKRKAVAKEAEGEIVDVKSADGQVTQVKLVGGRTAEQRAALPKFFWHGELSHRDNDGFSWGTYRFGLDSPGLRSHPAKAKSQAEAKFVVVCCMEDATIGKFKALRQRTPENPYLVKVLGGKKTVQQVFDERQDFLALNYDLRDGKDKQDEPMRGITIAPHNYYNGKKNKVDAPRQFFVTFQGRKTSKLRHELHDAFNKHRRYKLWRNISVETVMDRMWNVKQQTGDHKFNMKMNSTYVLLPKGDDRWSLRFSETIGAGAIPVILADGLTLPYEHIIDWSKAAIRLPNRFAQSADEIMKRLPSDQATIMKMRQQVYEINNKYFANPDVRADALLMEANAVVKKHGKYDPLWKPALAEPWLEDNRKGATEETKAMALKRAKLYEMAPIPGYLRTAEMNATMTADKKTTLIKRN